MVSKYVTAVWDVVFNVFKLSVIPHSCPELTNVECVCERVWIEIGILNIHFGHIFPLPFSLLSLPFHSDVGCWMVYFGSGVFVVSNYVIAVMDVVFNVFKLSVLPHSCPELTNVECVCVRVWIEIGILDIHFGHTFPLPFSLTSRFSFPFHSDVGCWMVYSGSEVFVVSNYVIAVMDVVFNVFKLSRPSSLVS